MKEQQIVMGKNKFHIEKYFLLLVVMGMSVFFAVLLPSFTNVGNLLTVISNACLVGIVGIGLTCIFATGEMDFSAANQFTFSATLLCQIILVLKIRSFFLAVLMTMAVMVCVGLFNAFLHIKVGIPAFLANMAPSNQVKGISKMICGGANLYGVSAGIGEQFNFLGQGYLFGVIPMPVICLIVVGVLMLIHTERTKGGRYLYAVGSNAAACRYLGIDASKQKIKGFVLCSLCCGFAGIIQASMINGASQVMGDNLMTSAITVLMLGACFLRIGVFNVPGTIVGALIIAILNNGMTMLDTATFLKEIIQGTLLGVSVTVVSIIKIRNASHK